MALHRGTSQDRVLALQETLLSLFGVGRVDSESLSRILERVSPEDVAEVLQHFDDDEKIVIFRALPTLEDQGTVLEETDKISQAEIRGALTEDERRRVISEMPVDDMVDHLEELGEDEQERLIASLGAEEAEDVEELRQYKPDTAGGMMTTEIITIPRGTLSSEALAKIQGNLGAEIINYVYVLEDDEVLCGVVSIREILRSDPTVPVDKYMQIDVVKVRVHEDREQVASDVEKYNLQALPVVDAIGRIRGIVTFDDVIEAVQEEHSEDMMRLAGTTAVHPLFEPIRIDVWKRLPFLMITLLGGLGVAVVLDSFRSKVLGVAIFNSMVIWVHLVSALSGNVAVVTSTVMVRGLATGEVAVNRLRAAVIRELLVAMIIGCILALLVGGAYCLYDAFWTDSEAIAAGVEKAYQPELANALFALVCAMVASLAWAGLVGGLVPVICRLSKVIDPAIASGPFVTITCDLSASAIFLFFIYKFLGGADG